MAGRWTFVLVALACAMVTAQGINDWETQNKWYIPQSGDLLTTGDRLKINCDTAGQRQRKVRTGVVVDQDKDTYAVALDVEGLVETYFKRLTDRDRSRPEEACLVKKGIPWKPGDWFYIISGIEVNPSTHREKRLDGQIGRLEQYNEKKMGFEVKLSERREPHVIKGAYLVKLSDSSTDKPTCDQEGVIESCHWSPAPAAPPAPPPLVPPAPLAPAAPTGPDVQEPEAPAAPLVPPAPLAPAAPTGPDVQEPEEAPTWGVDGVFSKMDILFSKMDSNEDEIISPGEWNREADSVIGDENRDRIGGIDRCQDSLGRWTNTRDFDGPCGRRSFWDQLAFWAGATFKNSDKNLDNKVSRNEFQIYWNEHLMTTTRPPSRSYWNHIPVQVSFPAAEEK